MDHSIYILWVPYLQFSSSVSMKPYRPSQTEEISTYAIYCSAHAGDLNVGRVEINKFTPVNPCSYTVIPLVIRVAVSLLPQITMFHPSLISTQF